MRRCAVGENQDVKTVIHDYSVGPQQVQVSSVQCPV